MIDYHLHLVPHGTDRPFRVDDVRAYAAAAGRAGVAEVAITEHLYRFPEGARALGDFHTADPDDRLSAHLDRYLTVERLSQGLDEYVETVLAVVADPDDGSARVRLGLEVDFTPGCMDAVAELLDGYPFDVLLGAVHWLGAWGFDQIDDPLVQAEWERRGADDVWLAYTEAVEGAAASSACDVLAHVDLAKVTGVRPAEAAVECEQRLVKAAVANDVCVEVSTAGLRKPVSELYPSPALLSAYRDAGVGITLASDAHRVDLVADRITVAAEAAVLAGYREVTVFSGRHRSTRPLESGEPS